MKSRVYSQAKHLLMLGSASLVLLASVWSGPAKAAAIVVTPAGPAIYVAPPVNYYGYGYRHGYYYDRYGRYHTYNRGGVYHRGATYHRGGAYHRGGTYHRGSVHRR